MTRSSSIRSSTRPSLATAAAGQATRVGSRTGFDSAEPEKNMMRLILPPLARKAVSFGAHAVSRLRVRLLLLVTLAIVPALGLALDVGLNERQAALDSARREAVDL